MLCKQHSDVDNAYYKITDSVQFIVDKQLDKGINGSIIYIEGNLIPRAYDNLTCNVLWNVLDNAKLLHKERPCYRASQLARCAVREP